MPLVSRQLQEVLARQSRIPELWVLGNPERPYSGDELREGVAHLVYQSTSGRGEFSLPWKIISAFSDMERPCDRTSQLRCRDGLQQGP